MPPPAVVEEFVGTRGTKGTVIQWIDVLGKHDRDTMSLPAIKSRVQQLSPEKLWVPTAINSKCPVNVPLHQYWEQSLPSLTVSP